MNLFVGSALVLTAILMPSCNSQTLVVEVVDSADSHPTEMEVVLDHHRTTNDYNPRRFPYDLGKKDITSKYYLASNYAMHGTANPSEFFIV